MNKTSVKRKSEEQSPIETINPCKRMKLEEIILGDVSNDRKNVNQFTEDKLAKRRNKLLTAMHLKKKYKYYCKKHDVAYLIESVRKKARVFSKENRNNLVQNFRSLHVSGDSYNFSNDESLVAAPTANTSQNSDVLRKTQLNFEGCDISKSNISDSKKDWFLKPRSPLSKIIEEVEPKNKVLDGDDGGYFENYQKPLNAEPSLVKCPAIKKDSYSFYEDYDSNSDEEESLFKQQKIVKCLVITKNPEDGNFIFSEGEDYIEIDYDGEEDNNCDCHYHENLKQKFFNCVYDSSSDEDF